MTVRAIAFTQQGQAWQEKLGFPVERGVPVSLTRRTRCCSSARAVLLCARWRRLCAARRAIPPCW